MRKKKDDSESSEVEVISKIGEGSFSNVYLCGNGLVVKKIDINSLMRKSKKRNMYWKILNCIENEISILNKITHRNIIKMHGYQKYRNIYILEFEYCEYNNYNIYMKSEIYKVNVDLFLREVSNGLKYIHDNSIIHRDIKLDNLLVKPKNEFGDITIKISDFGFACKKGSQSYNKICGTPYYMSPEILKSLATTNIEYDYRTDVWSLGICLYYILTEKFPYNEKEVNSLEKIVKYFEGKTDIMEFLDIDVKNFNILEKLLNVNYIERITINDLLDIINRVTMKSENEYSWGLDFNIEQYLYYILGRNVTTKLKRWILLY